MQKKKVICSKLNEVFDLYRGLDALPRLSRCVLKVLNLSCEYHLKFELAIKT